MRMCALSESEAKSSALCFARTGHFPGGTTAHLNGNKLLCNVFYVNFAASHILQKFTCCMAESDVGIFTGNAPSLQANVLHSCSHEK